MMRFQVISAVIFAFFAQVMVAQHAPAPLSPSSKWQMDYASGECRLIRSFGEGNETTTLQLTRNSYYDDIEMAIGGRGIPTTQKLTDVTVNTSTVVGVHGMHAQGFAAKDSRLGSLRFQGDVDLPKALRNDVSSGKPTVLSIRFVRDYAIAFDLGAMKAPLAALDRCAEDLIKGWGIDPAEVKNRRSDPQPIGDLTRWFRGSDYPKAALLEGQGGILVIRLVVGANGTVNKCEVVKSGANTVFEDLTCRLAMERGRFRPAIGANGRPIAAIRNLTVRWNPDSSFFNIL